MEEFVQVSSASRSMAGNSITQIVGAYKRSGYALFEFTACRDLSGGVIDNFARSLGLGVPFVPPLYACGKSAHLYDSFGVNVVKVSAPGSAVHPAFESTSDLRLHTDGTVQSIGQIRSALLLCVTPAWQGGETVIFNAAEAFAAVLHSHPLLASALLHPRALIRWTTLGESRMHCEGPVFVLKEGEILSRYSVTPTDEWSFDDIPNLKDAYQMLNALSREPHYSVSVKLGAGQGVLLANDKVSHGRTAFINADSVNRHMLRALFTGRPTGSVVSGLSRR